MFTEFLSSLDPNTVLKVSFFILGGIFFQGLVLIYREKASILVRQFPSHLTTGGVFFTFLGIAIGLLSFDPNNLNNSISSLLDGLSLAFWSSIIGMLGSIVLKGLIHLKLDKNRSVVTAKQMHQVLKEGNKNNDSSQNAILSELKKMTRATEQGNKESQQSFDLLSQELRDFSSSLSQQTSQQIAESLNEAIKDFNKGLVGQFGSNFQRLDDSVVKLLEWQSNYKQQVAQLTDAFESAVESVSATEVALENIASHTQVIPNAMSNLENTTDVWQNQLNELDARISVFAEMRQHALSAIPDIEGKMDELCKTVNSSLDKVCTSMESGARSASSTLQNNAKQLSSDFSNVSNEIKGEINDAHRQVATISHEFSSAAESIKNTLKDSVDDLNSQLSSLVKGTKSDVKNIGDTLVHVDKELMEKHREQISKSGQFALEQHKKLEDQIEQSVRIQSKAAINIGKQIENSLVAQSVTFEEGIQRELERVLTDLGNGLAQIVRVLDKNSDRQADDELSLARTQNEEVA
ncbi:hypothetical protein L1D16_03120 [Vibrio sp. Isolate31]|uniref:hypothetical protein n=1 Tax=unclassified Vibrio TaxID=2614977 RepID=UPI001EFD44B3|nr:MULTISPECIES: hypothetical protein [unclassified Vibrio]MCG9554471.1 hypothetical protein [Vibrio sp. Isolate32]MCG9599936.1 hypothetical protein [Vibrio sp. Isolate31]